MFSSLKKRISKSFNRAGEILTGIGPSPVKQFKNAIIVGDEEKAISLYTGTETNGEKSLKDELDPSKPFPSSKKNHVADIPLHLAAKAGFIKLVQILLDNGGDPSVLSSRKETVLHAVCSAPDKSDIRIQILDLLSQWNGSDVEGKQYDLVSVNQVDVEGNTAIHYAAENGLDACVERLVELNAIISIVNKSNNTCCESADLAGYKLLASMLELALVFQPVDESMQVYENSQSFPYEREKGKLILQCYSIKTTRINDFVEECIEYICDNLYINKNHKMNRSRAECVLKAFNWDLFKIGSEYTADKVKFFSTVKFDMSYLDAPINNNNKNVVVSDLLDLGEEENIIKKSSSTVSLNNIQFNDFDANNNNNNNSEIDNAAKAMDIVTVVDVCSICGEEMLQPVPFEYFVKDKVLKPDCRQLTCDNNHSYCIGCWSSYLVVQVSENGLGYLPCPAYKCGQILDLNWAPFVLNDQELVNRLLSQRQRNVIDCSGLKCCPIENCGLVLHIPYLEELQNSSERRETHNIPHSAICLNGHGFCLSCSLQSHNPCGCNDLQAWMKQVSEETKNTDIKDSATGDDIANALWVAANTKRCPRCNTPIEKDEGCNHMNCRKCRKEFCWICMQDWSLHSDNTGGYFQCNKFVSDSAQGGVVDVLWAEEKGNAHAETLRLRERGKKMARFIHYYTRFQAHGDSMKMESKMQKETIDRITSGLNLSMNGDLKWLQGHSVINPLLQKNVNPTDFGDSVLSSYYISVDPCLQFLHAGFEELLKCRNFLQWSYPYAYFEFDENDDNDITTPSRRKNRSRSRLVQDHRLSFELLQSDLEAMVETLSDVVARRRLRAARSQISLATRAAKSKRIELEYVIISHVAAREASSSSSPSIFTTPQSIYTRGSSYASRSRLSSSNNNNSGSNRNNSSRTYSEDDDDEAIKIVTLLSQMDMSGESPLNNNELDPEKSQMVQRLQEMLLSSSNNNNNNSENNTPRRTPRISQTTRNTPRSYSTNSETATGQLRRRKKSRSNNSSTTKTTDDLQVNVKDNSEGGVTEDNNNNNKNSNDEEGITSGDKDDDHSRSNESLLDALNNVRIDNDEEEEEEGSESEPEEDSSPVNNNNNEVQSQVNNLQMQMLSRRAEEETALNRAILLSLQESPADQSVNMNLSISEESIQSLMNMGFTREQSEQALRESRGSVELAANRLLE